MSLVPVLAKLAIPLGVGLLFIAAKKGRDEVDEKALELTKRAVEAMQKGSAGLLDAVADDFDEEDADPTTGGLLHFQHGRMVARGTRGFTKVPEWTDDKGLAVDNREIAVRLIQLEGRYKALEAWAAAYDSIGAKNLAKQLRVKAATLKGLTNPKGDKDAKKASNKQKADEKAKSKGEGASKPDLEGVIKQVTDALASGSVKTMRKVAADLRAHGYKEQADSLDKAADELEAELKAEEQRKAEEKAREQGKPKPEPKPEPPKPVTHRTVEVTSKLNSESAITKFLLGKADRWKELVAVNIPKDADGRTRQKVTTALIAQKNINPNRLGGLYPGLQPGQRLFVPDDWKLNPEDTKPSPKPDPKPADDKLSTGDSQTTNLITMLVGKSPGQEDTFMVKKWQEANGRSSDGKYGPGDAIYMGSKLGIVPPTPLYWPKSNTQKALDLFHSEMARLAIEQPENRAGYDFADTHAFQPGFEGIPLSHKIVSRRLGDGLG